ncbi:hypothetical protein, partial [Burkholderia cenocepacia]|uniref:hypothetical protein n=1 Tax=Burkholderia cenocepacia TaxID=95486 RepID=UPI002B24A7D0
NMPTVITSVSPAQRLSRAFNHVGQNSMKITALGGSVLRGHQHSGFLTGADTFVRSTLMAVAPGSHALSGAFLLVTFLWQDKEK